MLDYNTHFYTSFSISLQCPTYFPVLNLRFLVMDKIGPGEVFNHRSHPLLRIFEVSYNMKIISFHIKKSNKSKIIFTLRTEAFNNHLKLS